MPSYVLRKATSGRGPPRPRPGRAGWPATSGHTGLVPSTRTTGCRDCGFAPGGRCPAQSRAGPAPKSVRPSRIRCGNGSKTPSPARLRPRRQCSPAAAPASAAQNRAADLSGAWLRSSRAKPLRLLTRPAPGWRWARTSARKLSTRRVWARMNSKQLSSSYPARAAHRAARPGWWRRSSACSSGWLAFSQLRRAG